MADKLLEMKDISKSFSGVKVLKGVNLKVDKGEIHALVGENGAGKSTLMNILSGIYEYGSYEGDVLLEGKKCKFKNIKDSGEKGIVIIHQELALVPYLSIAENLFLGNEQEEKGIINWNKTHTYTEKLLEKVGLHENSHELIKNIGVGKQQLVEIAKALAKEVKLLILDEPTAALNDTDSEHLLNLLLELKEEGMTSIIISHKLKEVTKVADKITVIRDGSTIETLVKGKDAITEDRIIKGMVGRELVDRFPKRIGTIGEVMFEVKNWRAYDPLNEERLVLEDINLYVRKGEVVGIAGLMGAGRTELATSIFGKIYGKNISGQLFKEGKEIHIKNVSDAIERGLAYVTEDRKTAGLILIDDIRHNISLANLKNLSHKGVIDDNKEIHVATSYKEKLNIKCAGILQKVGDLSGGNQQKVVLSKWIYSEPDILILDEPTRGIDVGAKYEIYTIINELAKQGKAIILISSELPEVLGMSDRVYVMNEGKIVGELEQAEASQESVMKCIMQSSKEAK
ncbi:ABC transporter ATP-binding protein [Sporanaerobium hydrogeniformans]|uniref:ABC transporter ATP-binding protein n=1 Tax=Sporanaerobium hydrogeniformans TaxID=3072179 RepID=A0AC61DGJ3_9FIRM|nr:multiple monosaccharide ABC transporter ATP-binding protein [Sporanaerobium hydrogeniformans]PHV72005.1 ABC transporter ATP-binding protein [Sporanaerobium hydrogeniformans]